MHPKMACDGALPSSLMVYETVSALTARFSILARKACKRMLASRKFSTAHKQSKDRVKRASRSAGARVTHLGFNISGYGEGFQGFNDNVRLFGERHVNDGIALEIENIVHIHSFGDGQERDLPALLAEQLVQSVGTVFESIKGDDDIGVYGKSTSGGSSVASLMATIPATSPVTYRAALSPIMNLLIE
jgi:hypothetical protein